MNQEAFDEIDNAVWFEDCEQMSNEDERLISMGTLRAVWKELVLLRDVRIEIERRSKVTPGYYFRPPEVYETWEECLDLVTNGVESE